MSDKVEIIIISGLSGSGKSTAVKVFEDMGSYCVDNLPSALLPKIMELFQQSTMEHRLVVLCMDMREPDFVEDFPDLFTRLRREGLHVRLLFFEASEQVLVRRYSESRRVHPLGGKGSLREAIRQERREMKPIRELADVIIGTSSMSIRDLRAKVFDITSESRTVGELRITLLSFGYKYGLPFDADLVFDARLLPNPHSLPELRPMTGLDDPVKEYLLGRRETEDFIRHLTGFVEYAIPRYQAEGRSYLTIGIGCTGGRHRSVVMVQILAQYLEPMSYQVYIRNRDIQGN